MGIRVVAPSLVRLAGPFSFRVGFDVEETVGVALDAKIEAPIVVDASLPNVAGLVVLLGVERRVSEVAQKMRELLSEALLRLGGAAMKAREKCSARTARTACLLLEGTHRCARSLERAEHSACFHVRHRRLKSLVEFDLIHVHHHLRTQENAAKRGRGVEKVTNFEPDGSPRGLREGDLKLRFDAGECHSWTVAL